MGSFGINLFDIQTEYNFNFLINLFFFCCEDIVRIINNYDTMFDIVIRRFEGL